MQSHIFHETQFKVNIKTRSYPMNIYLFESLPVIYNIWFFLWYTYCLRCLMKRSQIYQDSTVHKVIYKINYQWNIVLVL